MVWFRSLGRCQDGMVSILGRCWDGMVMFLGRSWDSMVLILGRCWYSLVSSLGRSKDGMVLILGRCWYSLILFLGRRKDGMIFGFLGRRWFGLIFSSGDVKLTLLLPSWHNFSRVIPYVSRGRKFLGRSKIPWPGYDRISNFPLHLVLCHPCLCYTIADSEMKCFVSAPFSYGLSPLYCLSLLAVGSLVKRQAR